MRGEVHDELDQRLAHVSLEALAVLLKPRPVVVLFELTQEAEEGGAEMGGTSSGGGGHRSVLAGWKLCSILRPAAKKRKGITGCYPGKRAATMACLLVSDEDAAEEVAQGFAQRECPGSVLRSVRV